MIFVAGASVNGGMFGDQPSLTDLSMGDLKYNVDFRSVYATVLDNWLGLPSQAALGGSFATINGVARPNAGAVDASTGATTAC